MTLKMDMKVHFVIISIIDSYIFYVWEVPMYLSSKVENMSKYHFLFGHLLAFLCSSESRLYVKRFHAN